MFNNRETAGQQLAETVQNMSISPDIVLAINQDGLPVGKPIANALSVPLTLLVVNSIEAPFNKDLAIGAVTSNGTSWLNDEMIEELELDQVYVDDGVRVEQKRAADQSQAYGIQSLNVAGKNVLLVSDGISTGENVRASVKQLYDSGAQTVSVATPVIAQEIQESLTAVVDELRYIEAPATFTTVNQHYAEFEPLTDETTMSYLHEE